MTPSMSAVSTLPRVVSKMNRTHECLFGNTFSVDTSSRSLLARTMSNVLGCLGPPPVTSSAKGEVGIQFLIVGRISASVRVEPAGCIPGPGMRSLVLLASLQLSLAIQRLLLPTTQGAFLLHGVPGAQLWFLVTWFYASRLVCWTARKTPYATTMLVCRSAFPTPLPKVELLVNEYAPVIVFTLSGETIQFLPFNQLAPMHWRWHYRPFALLSSHEGGREGRTPWTL